MAQLIVVLFLCAAIGLVHGACSPWNGSPITSGTMFQLYQPTLNLWASNRDIPPYATAQGVIFTPVQSTGFYYNDVSGFSYSGDVGVQGVMSSYEGSVFSADYGGNEFSTGRSAWKVAIVAQGAAPNVILWASSISNQGNFGYRLGLKQNYLGDNWLNLARYDTFHLYTCDALPFYQSLSQGLSLNVGAITSFTQSAIIKLTTNGATGRIFDKITAGYADGWLLDSLGGKYRIILGSNAFINVLPSVPFNQYQFVTFSYNRNSGWGHLYINGYWFNSVYSPGAPNNNLPWRVGVASDGSNSFPGTIQRARFYWTLLSDGDVLADFNRAATEYGYTFAPVQ